MVFRKGHFFKKNPLGVLIKRPQKIFKKSPPKFVKNPRVGLEKSLRNFQIILMGKLRIFFKNPCKKGLKNSLNNWSSILPRMVFKINYILFIWPEQKLIRMDHKNSLKYPLVTQMKRTSDIRKKIHKTLCWKLSKREGPQICEKGLENSQKILMRWSYKKVSRFLLKILVVSLINSLENSHAGSIKGLQIFFIKS